MTKNIPIIEVKKSSTPRSTDNEKIPLNRLYTIKDMTKSLQTKYGINFQENSYSQLKEYALVKNSYLLDIASDIKELLEDDNKSRHDYIRVLLELYTNQAHLDRKNRQLNKNT